MNTIVFDCDLSKDLYTRDLPAVATPVEFVVNDVAWFDAILQAVNNFQAALLVINPGLAPIVGGTREYYPLSNQLNYQYPQVLSEDPTNFYNSLTRSMGDNRKFADITFFIIAAQPSVAGSAPILSLTNLTAVFYYL
jgi:hypothetical protein